MVGIDITDTERFKKIKEGDFHSWKKIFTRQEWQYSFKHANSAEHLAGIFAAKEATMKAVGGSLMGRHDRIEIMHRRDGQPRVVTQGEKFSIELSISHDKNIAIAVALLVT